MPLKLHQEEMPTINLTSMIDVVFLLLIFFMVGTRFSDNESKISINLPKASLPNAAPNSQTTKTVGIRQDGTIELDGRSVQLAELTRSLTALSRSNPSTTVLIRGDARAPLQRMVEVQVAINQAGVRYSALALNDNGNLSR
jgi:biopolymer transport protein ExbD